MKVQINRLHNIALFLIIYTSIVYLPGIFLYFGFQEGFNITYRVASNPIIPFSLTFISFAFFFFCYALIFDNFHLYSRKLDKRIAQAFIIFLLMLMVLTSFYFFINFSDSSFRHTSRFSESSPLVALLFLLLPIMKYLVAKIVLHVSSGYSINKFTRNFLVVFLICSLFSINSSLGIIIIPVLLLLLYKKKLLIEKIEIKNFIYLAIAAIPLMLLIVYVGIGNKIGYDFIFWDNAYGYLKDYFLVVLIRPTTSLFSVVYLFELYLFDFNFSLNTFQATFDTFTNRVSLLLGLGFNSELIPTVDRINYLELYNAYNPRAGATPNILASMYLMPFGVIFIPAYVYLVIRLVFLNYSNTKKHNVISILIVSIMILSMFEAPINIFVIIDQNFITFVFIILYEFFFNSKKVFGE